MPCGGIWPIKDAPITPCFLCGKSTPVANHWCEEWDCFLHAECVRNFLNTEEGKIVLEHGHHVQINEEVIQEEKA